MTDAPILPVLRTIAQLRAQISAWRAAGDQIGFVPTMGALHAGHMSLVSALRERGARVVASVFVNPKQFAPAEDLARYPRDEAGDVAKLAQAGCSAVFAPSPDIMYPPQFATRVKVDMVSRRLEGSFRPHFFEGVAVVVLKLFNQVQPDLAAFGEKDWQQLQVIGTLVRDLDLPIEIVPVATMREADGLAMSSRNAYLNASQRQTATLLHQALRQCAADLHAGVSVAQASRRAHDHLLAAGFAKVDYVDVAEPDTLARLNGKLNARPARILGAAWLGATRLIDNIPA